MKKNAVCFTGQGLKLIKQLNEACLDAGIEPAQGYIGMKMDEDYPGFYRIDTGIEDWVRERFEEKACLIFVGACGIAVRAISGAIRDKLTDSPVIVIDDNGQFVIPILSGHAGGADKIAQTLASLIGAVPVITTSTDVNGAFSPDVYAVEHRFNITDRTSIKRVSSSSIEGKPITISIKDYPPQVPVDIIVADETDAEYRMLLKPKKFVLGIGMKRGKTLKDIEDFIQSVCRMAGITPEDIYALCTIDIKLDEPGLKAYSTKYRIPLICFDTGVLNKAEGDFSSSEFVMQTVGVDNVCERAAVLGADGGELILRKYAASGFTAAIAIRRSIAVF